MRRRFPCGHVGKGAFCHFCKSMKERRERERLGRRAERFAFEQAIDVGIDMSRLPEQVALKAAGIIRNIKSGATYMQFRGKRLVEWDRRLVSVPVGWSHRIVFKDEGGHLEPIEVLSHEQYNGRISLARR